MGIRLGFGTAVLVAAAGAVLAPVAATGSTAINVKINVKTHTVTTSKFAIQFGNSTTNPPDDPERIASLTWKDSSGTVSGNLAADGGTVCNGDALEYWGQSYGSVEGQQPFLVVGGSAGKWTSPTASHVVIKTNTPTSCGETHIPVTTTYTFFGPGPHANEIKIVRKIPFGTHPFANPSQEGLRVYVPRMPIGTYGQVLYPDSSHKLVASSVCDNCTPLGSSAWGGRWFADNGAANSGLLVLRASTDQPGAELEIDEDLASGSNNTAIDLPQPAGGWKTSITETEYLCFYDTTTWPLSHRQVGKAVTLPAGCGA